MSLGYQGVPGSTDRPYSKDVEVNLKVNVTPVVKSQVEDKEVARCWHDNYAGECLICWRLDVGEHS